MRTRYNIIHLTHKTIGLDGIGKYHIAVDREAEVLSQAKSATEIDEVFFLSTCNRVEFVFATQEPLSLERMKEFMTVLYPNFSESEIDETVCEDTHIQGKKAVEHLFRVASSLDSLVIGEREIITQVRKAFERCWDNKLAGDSLRLLIRKTIETAKKVYTETQIAERPVSVVNLAYRQLRQHHLKNDARFIFVGAGKTNRAMVRFLKKHDFSNFVFFNRTLANAEKLAAEVDGDAHSLEELASYSGGFDVLVSCTGSEGAVVTPEVYNQLLQGETDEKIAIDLAMPNDIHPDIIAEHNVLNISIKELQAVAAENLELRKKEIQSCDVIIQRAMMEFGREFEARQVERAMRTVPEQVKEIKKRALETVFAKDIERLDKDSKETLEKVMAYMEKKYMSTPMKMAKEILLKGGPSD
jgi:glutamyl-tRNA reductase